MGPHGCVIMRNAAHVVTVGAFLMVMAIAGVVVVLQSDEGNHTVALEGAKHDVASMVQSQILSMDRSMFAREGTDQNSPTEDLLQTKAGGRMQDQSSSDAVQKKDSCCSRLFFVWLAQKEREEEREEASSQTRTKEEKEEKKECIRLANSI